MAVECVGCLCNVSFDFSFNPSSLVVHALRANCGMCQMKTIPKPLRKATAECVGCLWNGSTHLFCNPSSLEACALYADCGMFRMLVECVGCLWNGSAELFV